MVVGLGSGGRAGLSELLILKAVGFFCCRCAGEREALGTCAGTAAATTGGEITKVSSIPMCETELEG